MKKLVDGVQSFQNDVFPEHGTLFTQLTTGQSPHTLFITCADSRIDPCLITQTVPGELFVVRNAGNMVPPAGSGAHGESASIEYAVRVLKVQHVVVCGHSGCGAMAALRDGVEDLPEVQAWLKYATAPADTSCDLAGYIEFNVTQQLCNLRTYGFIEEAVTAGRLQLHGWVYDIGTGAVAALDTQQERFTALA